MRKKLTADANYAPKIPSYLTLRCLVETKGTKMAPTIIMLIISGGGEGGRKGGIPKFAGTLTTITDITRAFLQLLIANVGMELQLSWASIALTFIFL